MTTEHLKDGLAPARLYLEHHLLAGMATRETGAEEEASHGALRCDLAHLV